MTVLNDFKSEILFANVEAYLSKKTSLLLQKALRDVGQQSLFDCQRSLVITFEPSVETSILNSRRLMLLANISLPALRAQVNNTASIGNRKSAIGNDWWR